MGNNSEKNKVVTEHIEICHKHDRFVYIQRDKNFEVVGLNFCTGIDDLLTLSYYLCEDKELTKLFITTYQVITNMFSEASNKLQIDIINEVIDVHIRLNL